MRRPFVVLIFAVFLLLPTATLNSVEIIVEDVVYEPSQTYLEIERNWTANIILVGYDFEAINEEILMETLPLQREHYAESTIITYNIQYNLVYADASYETDLLGVIEENSVSGVGIGTQLNESELTIQRADPNTPRQIFWPRDGMSIDGFAVEDWLIANPYIPAPGLGYNFYLLNLSQFDSSDHVNEHWFDYHAADPDTQEVQDWFRLEFVHELNPPIMMQFAGIGGRGNVYALDPSADQWYMRWCRIWWDAYISTDYEHWTKDLDQKTSEVNLHSSAGVDALSTYLRDYIYDIFAFLLFPVQHSPAKYVNTAHARFHILCCDVDEGVSVDSLRWVTSQEKLFDDLNELYPFIDWNVQVEFYDINDEPIWYNSFWNYAEVIDGVTHVDGGGAFDYIYNIVRPYRIPTGEDVISIFGAVFIKDNMLMHYGDGTYTGLGFNGPDGGQACVWKSLERYYRFDNVTPKEGVSSVALHEAMHAVGFGHTWVHGHYTGDFSYGPMAYFSFHNDSSTFDRDWVQGTYLDQMEASEWDLFLTRQSLVGEDEYDKVYLAEANALDNFELARTFYNEMNWMECFNALRRAADWSKRMMWARHDITAPEIENFGTIPSEPLADFIYWAKVTDDSAGLENVTVHVLVDGVSEFQYSCEYAYGNWSTQIPAHSYEENLTLWVEAWDWAMNGAVGGAITLLNITGVTSPGNLEQLLLYGGIAAAVTMLAAGIVVFIRRRRLDTG